MPLVRVKAGSRYYFSGKEYGGGEAVEGVPEKNLRILTSPKGPLEYGAVSSPAQAAKTYQTAAVEPEPAVPLDEAPTSRRRTYRRRDLTAED